MDDICMEDVGRHAVTVRRSFAWEVTDFSNICNTKQVSNECTVGGYKWCVLMGTETTTRRRPTRAFAASIKRDTYCTHGSKGDAPVVFALNEVGCFESWVSPCLQY